MIAFVIGTTAELIKIWPVYSRIRDRGNPVEIWSAAQQPADLGRTTADFGVGIDVQLSDRTENLEKRRQVPLWATSVLLRIAIRRGELRRRLTSNGMPPLIIVHGDTMTSVLGALSGKTLGAPVCHIEAGLRSGDLRNPFPEELDRRIVARMARIHFAPDEVAVRNLSSARGRIVNTRGNTGIDSLFQFHVTNDAAPRILVSLHRSELLAQPRLLRESLHAISRLSEVIDVTVIVDSLTAAALRSAGILDELEASPVEIVPKLRYGDFIMNLATASAVITDSGGLQEECAALGKPCLIYRERTERQDGIGANARLAGLDPAAIARFGSDYASLVRPALQDGHSPSALVVEDLTATGFIR